MSDTQKTDPRVKLLGWLWVSAGVLIVGAALSHMATLEPREDAFEPRLVWPGFEGALANLTELQIQTKDESFTVIDTPKGWGVKERGGYPVRDEILRATLWGLGDMKLIEPKTARADRHQALGLVAPDEGGDAVHFKILGDGGALLSLYLGIPEGAEALDGSLRTYVRYFGEDQTWLAEGRLESEASLQEWLDLDVLDVDSQRIARVTATPADGGPSFTIARPDAETYNFALLGLGENEEMTGPTAGNGLGRALIAMTPSDVRAASDIGFEGAAQARFETFDGLAVTLGVTFFEEAYWITIGAERFVPAAGAAPLETDETNPDISNEAAQLNALAAGWAFKVPDWKGKQLVTGRAGLIKNNKTQ